MSGNLNIYPWNEKYFLKHSIVLNCDFLRWIYDFFNQLAHTDANNESRIINL